MRRVAGPQDDDWNADSHQRWTKCCDLAMLVVFLVAVIAAAADADIAAIGAALLVDASFFHEEPGSSLAGRLCE